MVANLQPAGKLTPRERIWAEIRRIGKGGKPFGIMDIEDTTRIVPATIYCYVDSLRLGGFLSQVSAPARRNGMGQWDGHTWKLERDVGVQAPRLDRKGKPVSSGSANLNLWRAMKRQKSFDFRDLALAAHTDDVKVSPQTAKSYCLYLARAGYLQLLSGVPRHKASRYRLVKDTGPKAPVIQRVKHVYDPNLGIVVWHPEANS